MKIVLFLGMLLAVLFALWQYETRGAARSEAELARVLQLDPRKVEPSTRALLLLEAIPHLRDSERAVAVKRLRSTLETMPRLLLAHRPALPVEAIRFSANGRAVLWYGKITDGITVERWSQREPQVVSWSTAGSNATFVDEAGMEMVSDQDAGLRKGSNRTGRTENAVMSRDGGYLAYAGDGILAIWRVQDVMRGRGTADPAFLNEVPHATTRLHCMQSTELCGVEASGLLTIIDVKRAKTLRSIPVDRTAVVHMSPSGRLVGVARSRAGMTIHSVRDGRKTQVDTSRLALEDFAFSADEKSVVVLDGDGVLHPYDAATGKPGAASPVLSQEQWKGPARVETVGDGRFVVWGAAKVRLINADLSTVAARFDEGGPVVMVKANARGDRLAIARQPGPLTLWDVSPKTALPLPDGELIASACAQIGRPLTAEEWATYIPNRRYAPSCR